MIIVNEIEHFDWGKSHVGLLGLLWQKKIE